MSEENQNIENFLRKGLGHKEFEFREEDWEKMEARLNAVMPPEPSGGMSTATWIGLSVVLVGISFFSGWMLSSLYREQPKPAVELSGNDIPEPSTPRTEIGDTLHSESPIIGDESLTESPTESPTDVLADSGPAVLSSRAKSQSEPSPAVESSAASKPSLEGIAEGDSDYSGDDSPRGILGKSTATATVPGAVAEGVEPVVHRPSDTEGRLPAAPGLAPDGFNDREEFPPLLSNELPVQNSLLPRPVWMGFRPGEQTSSYEPAQPAGPDYLWAIGGSFSPDFSATSLSPNIKEMGKAYGLLIEWQPLSKWRFATGVYKADKVYTAAKGDYRPPLYNGWPDGVEPVSTEAACDVLDIPLTAGFRLIDGRKTSFWLSGGISSYWMLSESYRYHYDDYEGYRIKGWYGENENSHPLSVVNLSVSVESRLTDRVSLKFEPFFKLPLGGVGYGDVKLYTAGSLVSLRYHFRRDRTTMATNSTDHFKNH